MKKRWKALWTVFLLAMLLMVCATAQAAMIGEDGEGHSKSKIATDVYIGDDYETEVILTLPAEQKELCTDIVFVIDKSTSQDDVIDYAVEMLEELKGIFEKTNARIKVGVVIFNRVANTACELTELNDDNYDNIIGSIRKKYESGTNMHAGIVAGKQMLDADDDVDATRKYLVFVSDGIGYMYGTGEPLAIANEHNGDSLQEITIFTGADCWARYHDNDDPLSDWDAWYSDIGSKLNEARLYEKEYTVLSEAAAKKDWTGIPYIKWEDRKRIPSTCDVALYLTAQVFNEAKAMGYHTFTVDAQTGKSSDYPWGMSYMKWLGEGKIVDFTTIKNDVLYFLGAGSSVVDVIGNGVDNDGYAYDFDFINDSQQLKMYVTEGLGSDSESTQEYQAVSIDENHYGFGEPVDKEYPYELVYYPDGTDKDSREQFVWQINTHVSITQRVQLQYTVKLVNPQTKAGVYGKKDDLISGIETNAEAWLNPVDSNKKKGVSEEFEKPSVWYDVEEIPEETPKPSEPGINLTFRKVWDDVGNENRPDSITLKVYRNGEYFRDLKLSYKDSDEKDKNSNTWTFHRYGWSDAVYTVAEVNVSGYASGVEVSENDPDYFVITNTYMPATGDDTPVTRYLLMLGGAALLIAAACVLRARKKA